MQFIEVNSKEELEMVVRKAVEKALENATKKKEKKEEEFLTIKELGEWLKLSRGTIFQLTKKGILPKYRVGNLVRYSKHEIIKALNEINSKKLTR